MKRVTHTTVLWLLGLAGFATAFFVFQQGPYNELVQRLEPARSFDEHPAGNLAIARERMARMDSTTVELYRIHLNWDFLAALANAVLLACLLLLAGRPWPRLKLLCLTFPTLVLLTELIENLGLAHWFSAGPSALSVAVVSKATALKFISLGLAAASLGLLLLKRAGVWLSKRRQPTVKKTSECSRGPAL